MRRFIFSFTFTAVMAAGCGDSTNTASTSSEPNTITDGASQTSTPTSASDNSTSGTSGSETTSSSSNPTTSTGTSGTTDTDGFECELACPDGVVSLQQFLLELGAEECIELFPVKFCDDPQELNWGWLFVAFANRVQSQIQMDGCQGSPPTSHPDLDPNGDFAGPIGELQCIGFLKTEEGKPLCVLTPLCQGAWAMWKKKLP